MIDGDNFIKNVEKLMKFELETGGETNRTIQQHVGKIVNGNENINYGFLYYDMLHRIDRILKGEKAEHWEGQNKMTAQEKINKKILLNNLREGW